MTTTRIDISLELIERDPTIRGRDAVHAATAIAYGIGTIVSPDHAFDGVPGLTRVGPTRSRSWQSPARDYGQMVATSAI